MCATQQLVFADFVQTCIHDQPRCVTSIKERIFLSIFFLLSYIALLLIMLNMCRGNSSFMKRISPFILTQWSFRHVCCGLKEGNLFAGEVVCSEHSHFPKLAHNEVYNFSLDKMFELLFTDCEFFRHFINARKYTSKFTNKVVFFSSKRFWL